jgi:DNA-binding IclR family transcriptional regulator
MAKNGGSSIQVIDRVAALLDAIAAHPEPTSLKLLSAETRLHPSTAFRILHSLADHSLVERTSDSKYTLGVKLLHFGSRVHGKVDLLREARPIMEWLRSQVEETVNLAVRERDEVVYVARAISSRMMRVEQLIGSRAPLHVTAVGKLFLAEAGEKACRDYARRTGLPRYTSSTITQITKLMAEIKAVARQGYALDDEEAEPGVACIGVPIYDSHGTMVAGLSISAPRERRRETWIGLIRKAGAELSGRLGHAAPAR